MLPLYQQFLDGALASPPGATMANVSINNRLAVPLELACIAEDGGVYPFSPVPSGTSTVFAPISWYLVLLSPDGALATIFEPSTGPGPVDLTVSAFDLCRPGDIGNIPVPTAAVPVPQDSGLVMVGAGVLPNGNTLIRTQYWKRSDESISLAPGETVTVSLTKTSGMTTTTSDSSTVASSTSASASAGWGPISASISASMSQSHTTSQSVSLTATSSQYHTQTHDNSKGTETTTTMRWILFDEITVYANAIAVAQIQSEQRPSLAFSYTASEIARHPETRIKKPLGREHKAALLELFDGSSRHRI